MEFSELLAELRNDRGWNQKTLGDMLNVSVSTISNYETGIHYPDMDNVMKIAEIFDVSLDYLFGKTTLRKSMSEYNKPMPGGGTLGDLFNTIAGFNDADLAKVDEYVSLLKNRTK